MTRTTRAIRAIAAGALVAGLTSACGGAAKAATCAATRGQTIKVPGTMAGLSVSPSEKARKAVLKEAATGRTYVCDASVFEMRAGPGPKDELRAVFQVIRLTDDARPEEAEFRRRIGERIAGTQRHPENIGGVLVYAGRHNAQIIRVWFRGRFMQVLYLREDPLSVGAVVGVDAAKLLQEAVALNPVPA